MNIAELKENCNLLYEFTEKLNKEQKESTKLDLKELETIATVQALTQLIIATDDADIERISDANINELETTEQYIKLTLSTFEEVFDDPENLEAIFEELKEGKAKQTSINLTTFSIPNTKAHKVLFNPEAFTQISRFEEEIKRYGENSLSVNKRSTDKIYLSVVQPEDAEFSRPLTINDRLVSSGLDTLFLNGVTTFTDKQLYKEIYKTDRPTPEQLKELNRTLSKLMTTLIRFDCTEYIAKRSKQKPVGITTKSRENLYYLEAIEIESYGQTVNGYKFVNPKKPPALLAYAQETGQIVTVPSKLLDTAGHNTKEYAALKMYLLIRIGEMKNNKNKDTTDLIKYETAFNESKIDIKNDAGEYEKMKIKRAREKMHSFLDEWKKAGFIKGYEPIKRGRLFYEVRIKLK